MTPPVFRGTLNFYDDPTHIKVYPVAELKNTFFAWDDAIVIASGRRCDLKRIVLMPCYFAYSLLEWRSIDGGIFWDILGFSDYLFLKKK